MALVNVYEKWSGVSGEVEETDVLGSQRGSTVRAFTVLYDTIESHLTAVDATGIPNIGAQHNTWSWLYCRRKRAVPLGPFLFEVVCEYWGEDSPLAKPAKISWQEASSTDEVDEDPDGNPYVNTVGDPLTGIMRETADPVRVYTRNEASYPTATMFAYWNRVNSDTVLTSWVAGTARMLPITAERTDNGSVFYYVVTYRTQFRADGWNIRVPNKGRRFRATAGGPLLSVRDALGMETALLRENGTLLNGTGGTGTEPPHWLTPTRYKAVNFSALGIF